jgi:hypothetical protein
MQPAADDFSARLRTMQIVHAAILMGPLVFGGIIAFIFLQQGRGLVAQGPLTLLTLIALVWLPAAAAASFVVSGMVLRSAVGQIAAGTWKPPADTARRGIAVDALTDGQKLLTVRQTADIIGAALLEGAIFLACIALFIEGHAWALAAACVGWVLLLSRFPTEGRIRSWLDEQGERLAQMRQDNPAAGPSD